MSNESNLYVEPEIYERVYTMYRHYIQHEDYLINHRTTWLITIQSFLWATFGFSYQKKFEVLEKIANDSASLAIAAVGANTTIPDLAGTLLGFTRQFDLFMLILCGVGLLTAFVSAFSITAAADAILNLRKEWEKYEKHAVNPRYLPSITGGGQKSATKRGIIISTSLPSLFCILWLLTSVLVGQSLGEAFYWSLFTLFIVGFLAGASLVAWYWIKTEKIHEIPIPETVYSLTNPISPVELNNESPTMNQKFSSRRTEKLDKTRKSDKDG